MPIYEYQCQKCGRHHEVAQRITDAPLTRCPECKGKLKKLMSLAGFQLKGSGWYKDGYASAKPEAKSESIPKTSEGAAAEPVKPTKAPSKKKSKNLP